jgi:PAS domain-containing protein
MSTILSRTFRRVGLWGFQVESSLCVSDGWHRELLASLPAAIYTTDAQGRITYYNAAATAL